MPTSRLTALAVLCAAVLLSGCGASVSQSSTTSTSTTSTAPGPDQFNPQLVPPQVTTTTSTKTTTKTTKPKLKVKGKGHARKGTGGVSPSPSIPAAPTGSAGSGGGGTHTVTVTKTITVTRTRTRTIVVRPNVPAGAHVPSSQPALAYPHFAVPGGDIGCRLTGATARCDIAGRSWAPPAKPRSCRLAWGQGLELLTSGARFVCAGDSVLDPTGPQVPFGRDDRVGSVTCQVRSFGVTCFDTAGHGFFVGRGGYDIF